MEHISLKIGRLVKCGGAVADLQSDPVLHQQSDLNVHQVEVLLQLLTGPDLGHHLLPQPCHLQLLLEVQVALVQQVHKLAHNIQGWALSTSYNGMKNTLPSITLHALAKLITLLSS